MPISITSAQKEDHRAGLHTPNARSDQVRSGRSKDAEESPLCSSSELVSWPSCVRVRVCDLAGALVEEPGESRERK